MGQAGRSQTGDLRALKALVIGMGVLVVLGTAVVIGVIIHRIYSQVGSPATHASKAPAMLLSKPASGTAFDRVIGVGPGASIGGVASADGRIAIWIKTGSGGEVVVVDPSTGQTVGRIRLGADTATGAGAGGN